MSKIRSPLVNGLQEVIMEDWWRDPFVVVDLVENKLTGLPLDHRANPLLADQIQWTLRLLRVIANRRYGHISMLAILDLLLAVNHFLVLRDGKNDSEVGGYDDDAEKLDCVFKKHQAEFAKFRTWFGENHH